MRYVLLKQCIYIITVLWPQSDWTALMIAAKYNRDKVVSALVKGGALVEHQKKVSRSNLDWL